MPTERYEVRAEPDVADDLDELSKISAALVDAAIRLMGELRDNPWLGEELRERYNIRVLKKCRKLRFDLPEWKEKPRYRIVYRNEPLDGAPGLVRIWAVAPREKLVAYARAATRITREAAREERRRRR